MVKFSSVIIFFVLAVLLQCCNEPSGKKLESGFIDPPGSAKPRVWWHWMNGNITKEGIKADLLWMKRVGIGGFQNFDANLSTPQVVEKRLVFMTPEWKDAFRFTAKLADSLGLEMAIAGSPGWSESGGPWVKPSQGMKKLVWSKTELTGGAPYSDTLPKPPSTSGMFQNLKVKGPDFYNDVAVIAFQNPENDISLAGLNPKIMSNGGKVDLKTLTDGDLLKNIQLPATPPGKNPWISFDFLKPVNIQSVTLMLENGRGTDQVLESSDNGSKYIKVTDIKIRMYSAAPQITVTFKPVTARYFRVTFLRKQTENQNAGVGLSELVLHTAARINHFEDKAGYSPAIGLNYLATPSVTGSNVINKSTIIDLTSRMAKDGRLDWTPPAGRWTILRFGYSLTGRNNHPASPEATGLEVDKLSSANVKDYFNNYLDQYKEATGGLMGKKGLQYVITDSWEAGVQNWTDSMMTEFSRRRGYDMHIWLPAIAGYIVESPESSDRFLWDFRKTISDLTAENHYDRLTTILHNRGMGRYTESHESGRAFIGDGMEAKRNADIPMSATWTPGGTGSVSSIHKADVRESASVAHIYGQKYIAAESMTAGSGAWAFSPERLKPTADMELACGLNRFVIHTSVHQPVNDKIPGLSLGRFGQWFTRHETWAEQALPWTTYLARSCFMLQQGKFVADIAWLYGEDNNITALTQPEIPKGYNYDFVNADALKNVLTVENGKIITPGGAEYKLLVIDSSARYMTLPVLKKIRDMIKAGAIVSGPGPVCSPSLSDDQSEFKTLADELWGTGTRVIGNGKLFTGIPLKEVLLSINTQPDFRYPKLVDDTEILYVHRKMKNTDIYWINNRNNNFEKVDAVFRVGGKVPEIWDPETGIIRETSYKIDSGYTIIPLKLKPNDAVFIVFRKKTGKMSASISEPVESQLAEVTGPWKVSFQPGRGAPSEITLNELTPWNENEDQGVKYFSGTGTYFKTVEVPEEWLKKNDRLLLDLGNVKNLAEVIINGKSAGIVWKQPFLIDITGYIKKGDNTLEIKVTNLWVNRIIGDQQPGVTNKITFTSQPVYEAGSPLLISGLMGPVKIIRRSSP